MEGDEQCAVPTGWNMFEECAGVILLFRHLDDAAAGEQCVGLLGWVVRGYGDGGITEIQPHSSVELDVIPVGFARPHLAVGGGDRPEATMRWSGAASQIG